MDNEVLDRNADRIVKEIGIPPFARYVHARYVDLRRALTGVYFCRPEVRKEVPDRQSKLVTQFLCPIGKVVSLTVPECSRLNRIDLM